jgi:hypothetical protein
MMAKNNVANQLEGVSQKIIEIIKTVAFSLAVDQEAWTLKTIQTATVILVNPQAETRVMVTVAQIIATIQESKDNLKLVS